MGEYYPFTNSNTPSLMSAYPTAVRPTYDPRTGNYETHHDTATSWNVSTTVVLSLGSLTGDDPKEMYPLGRAIDPEALNRHISDRNDDADLSFEYHGHHVTVHTDGRLRFAPLRGCETELSGT